MKEREWEICVNLSRKKDGAEWTENLTVFCASVKEAHNLARQFAREMATEHNAKVEDFYATDLETGEVSD